MNTQVASSKEEFVKKSIDGKDENKQNYGLGLFLIPLVIH